MTEQQIAKILEKHGFNVKKNGMGYDISQYTPAGEDWNICLFNLTEIKRYCEEFDPEEEFTMWVQAKGKVDGVPSIPELWKDQEWKQSVLNKVLEEVQ